MELIDLSRDLFHRTQVHPSHPPVVITVWGDHSEKKVAGNTVFTSKALALSLSDHSGTHVDAPVHFDPRPGAASIDEMPLENSTPPPFVLTCRTCHWGTRSLCRRWRTLWPGDPTGRHRAHLYGHQ